MRSTRLYTIAFLLALPFISFGQLHQQGRYEKNHEHGDYDFLIISMHEHGLALVREEDKASHGKKIWDIILLDTTLSETWSTKIEVDPGNNLIGHDYNAGSLYLLFRKGDSNSGELEIFKVENQVQRIDRFEIDHDLDFRLSYFCVVNDQALFGGYISKEPLVTIFDLVEKSNKIVPGFFHGNSELLDLRANINHTFNVVLIERGTRDKKKLTLKTMDSKGAILLEDAVELGKEHVILSALSSTLVRDELVVIGTWGTSNIKQACGFFFWVINPFEDHEPQFFDFAQMNEFLTYLKPKKVEKIKIKEERRRKLNKLPEFRTYVNLIRMEELSSGFTLLAEVYYTSGGANNRSNYYNSPYYPYYSYSPYGYNPYYSNRYSSMPYSSSQPTSHGDSRILHTTATVFDASGKIKADVGLPLTGSRAGTLDQKSDVIANEKEIVLAYKQEKFIYYKHKHWDEETKPAERDTLEFKLDNPKESIKSDSDDNDNGIRHWYGNNYYVWGYQSVKNSDKAAEDRSKYVFYINKLRLD